MGISFDSLVNPYSARVLGSVVEAADEMGVDVVIARPPDPRAVGLDAYGDAWARCLVANGREGLIVVTSELTESQVAAFDCAGVPLVVIDPINLERKDVASVGATNWAGGLSATEHLLALGHTRIAFAGGPPKSACSQERQHGYRAALEIAGVGVEVTLMRSPSSRAEPSPARQAGPWAEPCLNATSARRPSSLVATQRHSASSRRPADWAFEFPRNLASWTLTTPTSHYGPLPS